MKLYLEGRPIEEFAELVYLLVHVKMNSWGTKMLFSIDAGNDYNTKNQITDPNGQPVPFNSEADMLNYLHACGYDFVSNYLMTKASGEKVYKFIFKRIAD